MPIRTGIEFFFRRYVLVYNRVVCVHFQDHGKWVSKHITKTSITDTDWERLEPHVKEVLEENEGYSYSKNAVYVKCILDSG
jgi:hypothetical protein